jgi:hypothetical protein
MHHSAEGFACWPPNRRLSPAASEGFVKKQAARMPMTTEGFYSVATTESQQRRPPRTVEAGSAPQMVETYRIAAQLRFANAARANRNGNVRHYVRSANFEISGRLERLQVINFIW